LGAFPFEASPDGGCGVAEIGVERRRRPGLWPWLVGVLVVAALVWLFTRLLRDDPGEDAVESLERPVPAESAR
jgi:hypothetical protein